MATDNKVQIPANGEAITLNKDGQFVIPDHPIIPFIEGDGIGVDITPVMRKVIDHAVYLAYQGQKSIQWMEIYAGEKATKVYGENQWLPKETFDYLEQYHVAIKGPLMTPVGGGIRSLNVALRQKLDLYICLRPIRYFAGSPSPLKEPEKTDMVIFRENAEGLYAGIEWPARSVHAKKLIHFLQNDLGVTNILFPNSAGIGIKVISQEGTERLIEAAVRYTIDQNRSSITLVHKGNIMKYTEGAFCKWGFEWIQKNMDAELIDGGPWMTFSNPKTGQTIEVKDCIADAFLQQILLRPEEHDVIATMNLNGDYISDALAAQVGGIGIAPGANIGKTVALFEATHGTAPGYAGKDKVNPGSIILSAEMMLRHLGWHGAADYVIQGIKGAILDKTVTYDFARLMSDATMLSTSAFGEAIINNMKKTENSEN